MEQPVAKLLCDHNVSPKDDCWPELAGLAQQILDALGIKKDELELALQHAAAGDGIWQHRGLRVSISYFQHESVPLV